MTMDDYIKKMIPNHEVDEYGMIHCDYDLLVDTTKKFIKNITGKDAFVYFNYTTIEICFGTKEDLYTRPELVHTLPYANLFLI